MSEKHTPGPCPDKAANNGVCPHHNLHCAWPKCEPQAVVPDLAAEVERLKSEASDDEATRQMMADILSRTAVALRGPEPERTKWGWSDLPERVAAALAAIEVMQKAASINGAEVERLRAAIGMAYGYLWCVNAEPMTPHQYPPEKAAYEARKLLRDTMTSTQRGEYINRVVRLVRGAASEQKGGT